jgi:hypothetical protein
MRPFLNPSVLLALVLAAAGCSSPSSSDSGPTGRVNLRLSTTPTGGVGGSALTADVTVNQGGDVLVISRVQLVARKIKLEQSNGSCPTPVLTSPDGAGRDADSDDTAECPNLRLGPLLLDPPLGEGVQSSFSVDLPAGNYHELDMQIHKPTSSSSDAAFLAANPDFSGVSIKVTGTFNGAPFTYTTDLTAEVEMEFGTPVVVTEGGTTSLTLQLDVRGWFLAQGGGALLNPITLSQQGRQRVEQNIRGSFHSFEDENQDGRRD